MSWEEARNRELTHWSVIRDAIGTASPVDLFTEIWCNAEPAARRIPELRQAVPDLPSAQ